MNLAAHVRDYRVEHLFRHPGHHVHIGVDFQTAKRRRVQGGLGAPPAAHVPADKAHGQVERQRAQVALRRDTPLPLRRGEAVQEPTRRAGTRLQERLLGARPPLRSILPAPSLATEASRRARGVPPRRSADATMAPMECPRRHIRAFSPRRSRRHASRPSTRYSIACVSLEGANAPEGRRLIPAPRQSTRWTRSSDAHPTRLA